MLTSKFIKNINISLTNKCNLKCLHCDIWKQYPKREITLEIIDKILSSRALDPNVNITLTGGEPFMHSHITSIIEKIISYNPTALRTISTNGTLGDKINEFLKKFLKKLPPEFSLHISLDGIKKHEVQRGPSLQKVKRTLKKIRRLYPETNIKIKFTITPLNYTDIIPTYQYAYLNNFDFKIKLVEYAPHYTNKKEFLNMNFSVSVKKSIVESLYFLYKEFSKKGNKQNAHFIKNTIQFLLDKKKPTLCYTPFCRIFIMEDGSVYSCIHFNKLGNLMKETLDTLWKSHKAEQIRRQVRIQKCNKCLSYHGSNYQFPEL